MIMDLPVFFPEGERYAKEAMKGINLRFLNANNRELACISKMAVRGEPTGINAFCENNQKVHIGIGLFGSKDIKKLGNLTSFLLFAPLASADGLENIFQLIFSTWEAEAIKRYLGYCEIDLKGVKTAHAKTPEYYEILFRNFDKTGQAKIITDFEEGDLYFESFKLLDRSPININNVNLADLTAQLADRTAIIVIAKEKWKTLRKLWDAKGLKKKVVITTSSLEDWRVPPPIRKMFAKRVVYTYPRLAGNGENIINRFKQEFGYKPSVHSLLAYDATDIAMKTLTNAGPGYEAMKQHLKVNQFDTITMGKIGFEKNGNSYLIGRDSEALFDIKYIDSKGRYRKGQVES